MQPNREIALKNEKQNKKTKQKTTNPEQKPSSNAWAENGEQYSIEE